MEYWKAPGPDGITTDIFRKIALDIKSDIRINPDCHSLNNN